MAKLIHVRLIDLEGRTVAEADKMPESVINVSVYTYKRKNYLFGKLEGPFMTGVVFSEAGTIEEF